jgi:hypothetical protein
MAARIEGVKVGLTHYVPVPERLPNSTLAGYNGFPTSGPMIISGDTHATHRAAARLCVNLVGYVSAQLRPQLGTIGSSIQRGPRGVSLALTPTGIAIRVGRTWR